MLTWFLNTGHFHSTASAELSGNEQNSTPSPFQITSGVRVTRRQKYYHRFSDGIPPHSGQAHRHGFAPAHPPAAATGLQALPALAKHHGDSSFHGKNELQQAPLSYAAFNRSHKGAFNDLGASCHLRYPKEMEELRSELHRNLEKREGELLFSPPYTHLPLAFIF